MSSTPLLDNKNYTVDRTWQDEWGVYRETESTFQNYKMRRSTEWSRKDNAMRRDFVKLWREGDEWHSVDIDGDGEFMQSVERYKLHFSGHSAMTLEQAAKYIDTLRTALHHATTLEGLLALDKPPRTTGSNDSWLDLLTGEAHARGVTR